MARGAAAATTRECDGLHEGDCFSPEPFRCAIYFHIVKDLARLRAMTFIERKALLAECEGHSLRDPLHLAGTKPQYLCPHFDQKHPLTGAHVVALMVAALWVQIGERLEMAGALFDGWPELHRAVEAVAQDGGDARAKKQFAQGSLF